MATHGPEIRIANVALQQIRENPILHCNMSPTRAYATVGVNTMTSASMTFGRRTRLAVPRGSFWLGSLAAAAINGLRRLDDWQLRRQRNEPKTAEEVLAWASRIEATEPSFAADLRAAALRSMDIDKR